MAKISLPLSTKGNDDGWEMPCLNGVAVCGAAPFFNSGGQLIGYTVNVGMNDDDAENRDIILNAVNASGTWQKIDTAPRDGTTVLLWADAWAMSWGELQIGHFEGDGEGGGEWVTSEGAVNDNDSDFDPNAEIDPDDEPDELEDHNFGPTHWMPQPSGPTA